MKKEIIITVITMLVILLGEWITQNYTKKCVDNITKQLSELKEEVLNEEHDINELKNKAEKIYEEWREETRGLAYYIEHDEIEKIDVQIQIVTADLEANTPEDSVSEIEQGIYLLNHVEEKRSLKLKNVF